MKKINMANKKKKKPLEFTISVISKTLLMCVGLIVFIINMNLYDGNFNIGRYIQNALTITTYNNYAIMARDENITKTITNFCRPFTADDQVTCVIAQVSTFYNYSNHSELIRTPQEYIDLGGGVCRDSTLLYTIIFRDLGWITNYNFPSRNHVFAIISKEWTCEEKTCFYTCTLDGLAKECRGILE